MDLSVIIVTHNTREMLRDCLNSIYKKTDGISFEVIVIDNGSTDRTQEMLETEFSRISIIRNEESVGFGNGNNQGFSIANGDFIFITEPDTLVRTDEGLKKMIMYLKSHPSVGAIGPKLILKKNGRIQRSAFLRFPTLFTCFCEWTPINQFISKLFPKLNHFGKYYYDISELSNTKEVCWVMGGILMLKKEVVNKTKGFDPNIFLLGEDTDLCKRIRDFGYKIGYFSDTEVIHYWGANQHNLDSTLKWYFDGMSYYFKKHHGKFYLMGFYAVTLFSSFISILSYFFLSFVIPGKREVLFSQIKWYRGWATLLFRKSTKF